MKVLAIGCLSLVLTCITMPLVRSVAVRSGMLDRPAGLLKPQLRAVPYGGGIAIALAMSVVLPWARLNLPFFLVAGAMVVFFLGTVDDVHGVHPLSRLIGELVAGGMLCTLWPAAMSGWLSVAGAGACCAVLGAASMNACNMTDGSDGLSGTVILFAAGGLLVGWLLAGETALAGIAAASCGALVGFLIFNWPPARVYLGDSGAYLMGFMLTALCVPALSSWHAVVGVMCIMGPLELELLTSVVRRMKDHQGLATGDRRHIYDVVHVALEMPAAAINLLYSLVGVAGSLLGILVWRGAPIILGTGWLALLSALVAVMYRRPTFRKVEIR